MGADTLLGQIFLSRVDQRLHGGSLPGEGQIAGMISEIETEMHIFPFAASGAPVHARCVIRLGVQKLDSSYSPVPIQSD